MDLLPLAIFPPGGLSSSVITTVWVGVFVVAFFNLRLGWVLSGLVVPGYLVPLMLAKPWAAVVVLLESVVTYLIVWMHSGYLSRFGLWSSLFGRDRFFALVLVSVAVRVVFDGWLLPGLGEWLNSELGLVFDYRNNLHSFGLIIVALAANMYWKPGLPRGFAALAIILMVTYGLVRFGLMELTNFNISSLSYMYEDIAASILASPKAYIILITTALIASRMNLHYGWEFNGILIPALLALQWYQPLKILTTFAEAFLILGVASLLLRAPFFSHANIEGARKLLLFFNVSFAYKLLLGYLVVWFAPEVKTSDTYGFGYLLATLMAVKMHDKNIAAHLSRATLQASLVAVAGATVVGFLLTLLPTGPAWNAADAVDEARRSRVYSDDRRLVDRLRRDQVALYRPREEGGVPLPLPREVETFTDGVRLLLEHARDGTDETLRDGTERLGRVGYVVTRVQDRYLHMMEDRNDRGWGMYVLDTQASGTLAVEVPAPLDERGTLEAGAWLFDILDARALAIGGTRRNQNPDRSSDVLTRRDSIYHAFHRLVGGRDVLQVRAHTAESVRRLTGRRRVSGEPDIPDAESGLWVLGRLPPGLDLGTLEALLGDVPVHWDRTPIANLQRSATATGFAELRLNRTDLRGLLAHALGEVPSVQSREGLQRIDGFLKGWLLSGKSLIARRGTDAYRLPRPEELLYLDEEVLTPLVRMVGQWAHAEPASPGGPLGRLNAAASVLGYRLVHYRHRRSGRDYLILMEEAGTSSPRYWGTFVFRLGPANGYLVQVPRPLYEVNSFEYAVSLFERLDGRALLIAGADPRANRDGSADLVRLENIASLFTLASQVVVRELGDDPMLVIHSRAFGIRPDVPPPDVDALVTFSEGGTRQSVLPALARDLLRTLGRDGLDYRLVDGRLETAGYEVGSVPQSLYPGLMRNKWFGILWMSPFTRAGFRQQTENTVEDAQFRALDIPTMEADLADTLRTRRWRAPGASDGGLEARIAEYVRHQDVVVLHGILTGWRELSLTRLIDRDSRQSFLLAADARGDLRLVVNLNPLDPDSRVPVGDGEPLLKAVVDRFVDGRLGWLVPGPDGVRRP